MTLPRATTTDWLSFSEIEYKQKRGSIDSSLAFEFLVWLGSNVPFNIWKELCDRFVQLRCQELGELWKGLKVELQSRAHRRAEVDRLDVSSFNGGRLDLLNHVDNRGEIL